MRSKALSKSDKYAIEFLYSQNKSVEDICKELNLTQAQVAKIIRNLTKDQVVSCPPPEAKTDKTKNLMIRQTSAKKQNSVSIMTEGAAQLSDEFIKTMSRNTKNTDNYIYRRPE